MNHSRNMDSDTRKRRWQATQNIDINWTEVFDAETFAGIHSCSLSTGAPIAFYAMPLLSTSASLMSEATVLVHEGTGWREPSIIWSVVSAPAGKYNHLNNISHGLACRPCKFFLWICFLGELGCFFVKCWVGRIIMIENDANPVWFTLYVAHWF